MKGLIFSRAANSIEPKTLLSTDARFGAERAVHLPDCWWIGQRGRTNRGCSALSSNPPALQKAGDRLFLPRRRDKPGYENSIANRSRTCHSFIHSNWGDCGQLALANEIVGFFHCGLPRRDCCDPCGPISQISRDRACLTQTSNPMRMKIPNQFIFLTILASAVLAGQAAIVPAPDDQEEPSVVANGNGYFVVWADKRTYSSTEYDIYGARVSSAGEVLDPLGIPICTDPGRQTSPRVAFDGEKYLVVWEDDRESTADFQLYQIYGARLGTSGQVIDPNGFKITTNRVTRLGPAVASNGQGFFVAWEDWQRTDSSISDVYGSFVSSDGVVANPDGIPLVTGAGWQAQPRLAFANGEYLMTYRDSWITGPDIWGIRVSTAGQPLSSAFRISNSNDEAGGRYGLASNGRDCFVVWGDDRGSPSGFGYPKIYGTLVRSNGVVASPNGILIATSALYQERPRIASDGNDFLVVWQASDDPREEFTDIYGVKITGGGTVGAPAKIPVNLAPGVQYNPDVAFASGNYLVAWQDGRSSPNSTYPLGAYDIFGTFVAGTGA